MSEKDVKAWWEAMFRKHAESLDLRRVDRIWQQRREAIRLRYHSA